MEGLAILETELFAGDQSRGLTLIGRRHLRSNNSWMHNLTPLVRGKKHLRALDEPRGYGRAFFGGWSGGEG